MTQFTYQIKDELGIHARPAGLLVKKAKEFSSAIKISKEGKEVDLKGLMGLMMLGVKQGDIVNISMDGADEEKAASEIELFFKENL